MNTRSRKVLFVSNAPDLNADALSADLGIEYSVDTASDSEAAHEWIIQEGSPHLVMIDLEPSDAEGLRFAEELHEMGGMPIITIGQRNANSEVALQALRYADDFIRREYATPEEVGMRIRRVLSRVQDFSYAHGPEIEIAQGIKVDHLHRRVTVNGDVRKLTPIENTLLSVLIKHRGQGVDADTLIDRVWQLDPAIKDRNALRVHIHRLRHKLEADPHSPVMISTERGSGYRLKAEEGSSQ
jgi:DNA-binding response OmpR family regulator